MIDWKYSVIVYVIALVVAAVISENRIKRYETH